MTNKYLPLSTRARERERKKRRERETRVIGIYSNVHFPALRLLVLIIPKLRFATKAAWARTKARRGRVGSPNFRNYNKQVPVTARQNAPRRRPRVQTPRGNNMQIAGLPNVWTL